MLLQIHDELVFEVPSAQAEALDAFVRDRMAHAMDLRVPLEVSTGRGATWAEA